MTSAATLSNDAPFVTPWPDDRRWVYSITFDEALSDLHRFAVPILAEFGVPGHLEVVVGHIGKVRQIGQSSFNGFKHMDAAELREMLARGWGVGNHTWSHEHVTPEMVEREIGEAKRVLEEAVGEPVTVYCAAGDNSNMSAHVLKACRRHEYLAAMSITDAINRPDLDHRGTAAGAHPRAAGDVGDDSAGLLWLNRTFLHTQGYGPFWSEFDPFRGLHHARRERGWVIDYLHCPLEKAVHPNKDCSAAELRERIETVCGEGGSDVWLARVEEAVDYRYTRRVARIEPGGIGSRAGGGHGVNEYRISAPDMHPSVRRRTVTLALPAGAWAAEADGQAAPLRSRGGRVLVDVDLSRPRVLRVRRDTLGK